MKRPIVTGPKILVACLALLTLSMAIPSSAHRYDRRTDGHPLRLVGYVLHPIGIAFEYGLFRPVHWLVSQPDLDIVFGHQANLMDEGTYFEWTHGDYEPSIKVELEAREANKKKISQ